MASVRCILRKLNRHKLVNKRTIMTTSNRAQKAVEELQTNPYYEKYLKKIAQLQQTSPEEFLKRIESHAQKESDITQKADTAKRPEQRQYSNLLKPKSDITATKSKQGEQTLDSVMKLDLIQDKSPEDIEAIWMKYHLQKEDAIAAIIPAETFDAMQEVAGRYPMFLFPLPRSQGYEFIVSQFHGNSTHFTPLICYQVHKENAPECLTIHNYIDLKAAKGIVLMRGEYDKSVIDATEAQCLVNQLQLYYNSTDSAKMALLEKFTTKQDEFKHMDLIRQIESLSIS